jgi:glucose-1-phosphate thymidylyltransferase
LFDAVVLDEAESVREIRVKQPGRVTNWVWGAFKLPGHTLAALEELWLERGRVDEYVGTLVNAWLARGGRAIGVKAGKDYVDVGTLNGYREAIRLLSRPAEGKTLAAGAATGDSGEDE